jgi:6-phosphogluconolactonase
MTTKLVPGTLVAAPDSSSFAIEAAARIGEALRNAVAKRGRATLALSGGKTPVPTFAILARDALVDWSQVEVFWVDERAVPPTSPRSNYGGAKDSLLDAAKISEERVHRMRGEQSIDEAARLYEALMRRKIESAFGDAPSIDVMVMGIGDDGHTASLFPGEPEVNERERLVVGVPARNGREARITLTAPVIENARAIVVLAQGKEKATPLENTWLVEGNVKDVPARILRDARGSICWIIDRAAGGLEPA